MLHRSCGPCACRLTEVNRVPPQRRGSPSSTDTFELTFAHPRSDLCAPYHARVRQPGPHSLPVQSCQYVTAPPPRIITPSPDPVKTSSFRSYRRPCRRGPVCLDALRLDHFLHRPVAPRAQGLRRGAAPDPRELVADAPAQLGSLDPGAGDQLLDRAGSPPPPDGQLCLALVRFGRRSVSVLSPGRFS